MKKRKLKRLLHEAQTDAYIKGAILRSCHHFAEMVRDFNDTDQRQWEGEYRGGHGDCEEWSGTKFMAINARRIEEMTRDY